MEAHKRGYEPELECLEHKMAERETDLAKRGKDNLPTWSIRLCCLTRTLIFLLDKQIPSNVFGNLFDFFGDSRLQPKFTF